MDAVRGGVAVVTRRLLIHALEPTTDPEIAMARFLRDRPTLDMENIQSVTVTELGVVIKYWVENKMKESNIPSPSYCGMSDADE